jgi:quercetin dioxygenase-like cupin family protein
MAKQVRRVVTAHDARGRAIVQIDDIAPTVVHPRPGSTGTLIWSTETLPADNGDSRDGGVVNLGTSLKNGSVFRVVEYAPGVAPRNHRTQSIDYAVVMSGEIDMALDDTEVHLKAGDVLVQRGTIHNWENRGSEPCRIAFVLIGAQPLEVAGKDLGDVG